MTAAMATTNWAIYPMVMDRSTFLGARFWIIGFRLNTHSSARPTVIITVDVTSRPRDVRAPKFRGSAVVVMAMAGGYLAGGKERKKEGG